jgi:hypothetical protein
MKRPRTPRPDQLDEMVAESLALNVTKASAFERYLAAKRFVATRPMRENSRDARLPEVERVYCAEIAPHLHFLMAITDATVAHRRLREADVKRRHIFNQEVVKPAYEHPGGPGAWVTEIMKQGGIVHR